MSADIGAGPAAGAARDEGVAWAARTHVQGSEGAALAGSERGGAHDVGTHAARPRAREDVRAAVTSQPLPSNQGGGVGRVEGESPSPHDSAAPGSPCRPKGGAGGAAARPWYQVHTSTAFVYPHGVRLIPNGHIAGKRGRHLEGIKRGAIQGFSSHAASRLRLFCVTKEVPGCVPVACTLTTRGIMTPEEWRAAWKRFRNRAVRLGIPLVFRVELQRRKTPHVHLVAWMVPQEELAPRVVVDGELEAIVLPLWFRQRRLFWEGWLECIKEQNDPESRRHAVDTRELTNHGWMVYMALHHGKHKKEQLGWQGKQWGVVCAERFKSRPCREVSMTDPQRFRFQRVLRRLIAGRERLLVPRKSRGVLPFVEARNIHAIAAGVPGARVLGGSKGSRTLPPQSSWLRCHPSDAVERALAWALE